MFISSIKGAQSVMKALLALVGHVRVVEEIVIGNSGRQIRRLAPWDIFVVEESRSFRSETYMCICGIGFIKLIYILTKTLAESWRHIR